MDTLSDWEKALAIHTAWMEALTPEARDLFVQEIGVIIQHVNSAIAQYYGLPPSLTHHHLVEAHMAMIGLLEPCLLNNQEGTVLQEEYDVP